MQEMQLEMADASALGPHRVGTLDAAHLCTAAFSSATIYYPEGGAQLPSIVIVGGWGCGEQVQAAWAPFYASHGIVAMTIGTPAPWKDFCEARAIALLDASVALQSEHARAGSVLLGRLDTSNRAVHGYSLGGGGAQLAALRDPTLKCIVTICPDNGSVLGEKPPAELTPSVPVLFVCGENDTDAPPQAHAWAHYRKTGGAKLLFEIEGGTHFSANGPAGDATEDEMTEGASVMALLCNSTCALLSQGACVPCPCRCGIMTASSGHARADAPRAAVGRVALAWLRLFLLRDETARPELTTRPGIARNFESSGIAPPVEVMERE